MGRVVDELREERTASDLHRRRASTFPCSRCATSTSATARCRCCSTSTSTSAGARRVALLGTNGAGKSTLLRLVSGLGDPEPRRRPAGRSRRSRTRTRPRGSVAASCSCPGVSGLRAAHASRDNLRVGAFLVRPRPTSTRGSSVPSSCSPRCDPAWTSRAGTLSGGQQQMLGLAKALVLEPELLLIDELSLGLAPLVGAGTARSHRGPQGTRA